MTRERMYLETMERVLGNTDKIIVDSKDGAQGVVPYLPLNELSKPSEPAAPRRNREASDETECHRRRYRRPHHRRADRRLFVAVHRLSDAAGAGAPPRQAAAADHRARPARQGAVHRHRRLYRQAHPRPGIAAAGGDRLRPEAAGGRRLRALQNHRSAALLSDARFDPRRQFAACHSAQLGAAARARRSHLHPGGARPARRADGSASRA